MSPKPLGAMGRTPDEDGDLQTIRIVHGSNGLYAEELWSNGYRRRADDLHAEKVREAWEEYILDPANPRDLRKQAINTLIEFWDEYEHKWDGYW